MVSLGTSWGTHENLKNTLRTSWEHTRNVVVTPKSSQKIFLTLNPTNALFWFSSVEWAQETRGIPAFCWLPCEGGPESRGSLLIKATRGLTHQRPRKWPFMTFFFLALLARPVVSRNIFFFC